MRVQAVAIQLQYREGHFALVRGTEQAVGKPSGCFGRWYSGIRPLTSPSHLNEVTSSHHLLDLPHTLSPATHCLLTPSADLAPGAILWVLDAHPTTVTDVTTVTATFPLPASENNVRAADHYRPHDRAACGGRLSACRAEGTYCIRTALHLECCGECAGSQVGV